MAGKEDVAHDLMVRRVDLDMSAAFRQRKVALPVRNRQLATWDANVAESEERWESESRAKFVRHSGAEVRERMIQNDAADLEAAWRQKVMDAQSRALFVKARDALFTVACHKYGSVRGMERYFEDVPEEVTLEEFSTALKRKGLQTRFPREKQRVIFETVPQPDADLVGIKMSKKALFRFLDDDAQISDPEKKGRDRIPAPAKGGDIRRLVERGVEVERTALVMKERMPPRLRAIRDAILDALVKRTRFHKQVDAQTAPSEYLMATFKQWDKSLSGKLSPRDIVTVLGPQHLNLGVNSRALKEFIDYVDLDGDTKVSYKEFVRVMELTEVEPDYNPFFDHRRRELVELAKTANSPPSMPPYEPLPLPEGIIGFLDASTMLLMQPHHHASTSPLPRPEDLLEDGYVRPLATSQQMRGLEHKQLLTMTSPAMRRVVQAQTASTGHEKTSSFGGGGGLLLARTGSDIFDEMSLTATRKLEAICPRFVPPPATDWSRTGCGGDGIDPESSMFCSTQDRFATTTNRYYPPPLSGGGGEDARHCFNQSGLLSSSSSSSTANHLSDSSVDFHRRMALSDARIARTERNRAVIAASKAEQTHKEILVQEANRRRKALEMYKYKKASHEVDLTMIRKIPPEVMQRRTNPKLYTRMWGGSPHNMLHHSNSAFETSQTHTTHRDLGRGASQLRNNDPFMK